MAIIRLGFSRAVPGIGGVDRIQVRVSAKLEGESWLAAERDQSGSEGEFRGREWCGTWRC